MESRSPPRNLQNSTARSQGHFSFLSPPPQSDVAMVVFLPSPFTHTQSKSKDDTLLCCSLCAAPKMSGHCIRGPGFKPGKAPTRAHMHGLPRLDLRPSLCRKEPTCLRFYKRKRGPVLGSACGSIPRVSCTRIAQFAHNRRITLGADQEKPRVHGL